MRLLAALLVVAFVAGCGKAELPTPAVTSDPEPRLSEFIAAANLPPCPGSTGAAVERGLPAVTLDCLGEGPAVALDRLPRKPYVLNVWASWCRPCTAEMPLLLAVQREAGDRVGFLGIDFVDERISALAWAADLGVTFPSVQDPNGDLRGPLRIVGPPVTYFVRADGTIAGQKVGEFRSEQEVREAIARNLEVEL